MTKKILEPISVLAVSAFAGAAVALPFNLLLGKAWSDYLSSSALIGLVIGIAAYSAFTLVMKWINRKPFYSFLAVIAIVGAGTGGAVYLLATRDILLIALFILVSEAAGICATSWIYGRSRRMNRKLDELKKKLADEIS